VTFTFDWLQCGATLDDDNHANRTPFHEAADAGHLDVLQTLMNYYQAQDATSGHFSAEQSSNMSTW
jgi:ankyrin repeat protein